MVWGGVIVGCRDGGLGWRDSGGVGWRDSEV